MLDFDKTDRMKSRDELVQVLQQAGGANLHKRYILCPFHNDTQESAEIRQSASTGRWYFYCHKCGLAEDVWDLQARTEGRSVADLLREAQKANAGPSTSPPLKGRPTPASPLKTSSQGRESSARAPFRTIEDAIAFYKRQNPRIVVEEVNHYTDPDTGKDDAVSIRYRPEPGAKKSFTQLTPLGDGWINKGPAGDKVPMFNREGARAASRVLLVEGEACVRAVTELGISDVTAVTSLGGSKQGHRCDWSPLAGKSVWVWADNDATGHEYAEGVINQLKALSPPPHIYRIRVEELELDEGGDVVDYLAECGAMVEDRRSALELVMYDAEALGASKSLADLFKMVEDGKYVLVPFQNKEHLTSATQALIPGTVTIIAGSPEAGKSFWLLEEAWRQHEAGASIRIMMLEDDHAFHLRRALAQMSGEALLLDHQHTERNIQWAKKIMARYKERLDSFGSVLEAPGSEDLTVFNVADWVEKHARAGVRLIYVDPITAASTSEMSWKDDRTFMFRVKKAAEEHGCSVILSTHPKLGQAGKPSLSGLAGGASYSRFCQTMIWLEKLEEPTISSINTGFISSEMEYQRVTRVYKARSGKDAGKKTSRTIAVQLNPTDLCFTELGMIQ
jgi:hypothetical protein